MTDLFKFLKGTTKWKYCTCG